MEKYGDTPVRELALDLFSEPGGIRTHDLLIRRSYPAGTAQPIFPIESGFPKPVLNPDLNPNSEMNPRVNP